MSTSIITNYLGPYRLLNIVNTGQTSRLWQAYDDAGRRYVGIKTLQEKFTRDSVQVNFLKREYEVAGPISHRLLIDIESFAFDKKIPYLSMEWCSAPNLKMLLNRGYAQSAIHLQKIIPEMVESLVYFHSKGWIHRDIKPDNFLFSEETGLKLIDFALASKKPNPLSKLLPFSTKPQGTASYMSPEQIRGKGIGEQSDIYNLGCTFFELLAGRPPYSGTTLNDLLQKHLTGIVPPITARNNNITPEMAEVVRICLMKDMRDRPRTSEELYALIKSIRVFKKTPTENDLKA